ncbi:MAG: hypothetical protein AB8G96_02590 [Phycisphaerales bacterium]
MNDFKTVLIVGLLVMIGGGVLGAVVSSLGIVGYLVQLAGVAIFTYGCVLYAKHKNMNPLLGLLGIFTCIGFAILYFLPEGTGNKA